MRGLHAFFPMLAVAAVFSAPAGADQTFKINDWNAVIVPTGSPVQFDRFNKGTITARFRGTFVLNGTYHITYTPPFKTEDMSEGGVGVYFTPDQADLARLPYWQSHRIRAKIIEFDNPTDILGALPPTGDLRNPNTDKAVTTSGHIAIKVTGYRMNIECDYPYYTVHFVSLVGKPQQIARRDGVDQDGC